MEPGTDPASVFPHLDTDIPGFSQDFPPEFPSPGTRRPSTPSSLSAYAGFAIPISELAEGSRRRQSDGADDLFEGFPPDTDFRQGQEQMFEQVQQDDSAQDHNERFPTQHPPSQHSPIQQAWTQQAHGNHGSVQQNPVQHAQEFPHQAPGNAYPFPIQHSPIQHAPIPHIPIQHPQIPRAPIPPAPSPHTSVQHPQIPHTPIPQTPFQHAGIQQSQNQQAWRYHIHGQQIPARHVLTQHQQEQHRGNQAQVPLFWGHQSHRYVNRQNQEASVQRSQHSSTKEVPAEQQSSDQQVPPQQATPEQPPDQVDDENPAMTYNLTITFEGSGLESKVPWSLIIHQKGHAHGTRYRVLAYDRDGLEVNVEAIATAESFRFNGDYDDKLVVNNDNTWGYITLITEMSLDEVTLLHEKILKAPLIQPQYRSPPKTSQERVLLNTQWCIIKCLQHIGVEVGWPLVKGYSRNIWAIETDTMAYAQGYSTGWSAGVKDLLESMKGLISAEEREKLENSADIMYVDEEAHVESEVSRLYAHFTSGLEGKMMGIWEEMR